MKRSGCFQPLCGTTSVTPAEVNSRMGLVTDGEDAFFATIVTCDEVGPQYIIHWNKLAPQPQLYRFPLNAPWGK